MCGVGTAEYAPALRVRSRVCSARTENSSLGAWRMCCKLKTYSYVRGFAMGMISHEREGRCYDLPESMNGMDVVGGTMKGVE